MVKIPTVQDIGNEKERYKIGIMALEKIRQKSEGKMDKKNYSLMQEGDKKQEKMKLQSYQKKNDGVQENSPFVRNL